MHETVVVICAAPVKTASTVCEDARMHARVTGISTDPAELTDDLLAFRTTRRASRSSVKAF